MNDFFERPEGRGDRSTLLIALSAIAIFALMGGLFLYARQTHVKLDPSTLCPADGTNYVTILLMDVSDPLTKTQQQRVKQLARDLRDKALSREAMRAQETPGLARYVERHEKISLYELRDASPPVGEVLQVCNPGNPEEESALIERATRPARRALARWAQFEKTLISAFPAERMEGEAARSPLLEAISFLSASETGSVAQKMSGSGTETRFIVISDFLQHSTLLSQYANYPPWEEVKEVLKGTDAFAELRGINFILFYVRRSEYKKYQTDQHKRWWLDALPGMGGRILHLEQW